MTNQPNVRVGVGVYILNERNQLLLGKRLNAHGTGCWCPPGGHLDFGETQRDCAARETMEETGLEVTNFKELGFTNDIFKDDNRHYITLHIAAELAAGCSEEDVEIKEPHKCEKWEWFNLDQLPSPLFVPVEHFFNKYGSYSLSILDNKEDRGID